MRSDPAPTADGLMLEKPGNTALFLSLHSFAHRNYAMRVPVREPANSAFSAASQIGLSEARFGAGAGICLGCAAAYGLGGGVKKKI